MTSYRVIAEYFRYLEQMTDRGRVVCVYAEDQTHTLAVVTFFLLPSLDAVHEIHERPMWEVIEDDDHGEVCYIDKLVALTWTPSIRRQLEFVITAQYPQITTAVWHRPSELTDRLIVKELRHVATV